MRLDDIFNDDAALAFEAANAAQQAAIAISMKRAGKTPKNEDEVQERFNLPKHLFGKRDRFKSLRHETVGGSPAEKLIKDIEYQPDQDEEDIKEGHGRYWCSTDKRWKERKGPKQSRG